MEEGPSAISLLSSPVSTLSFNASISRRCSDKTAGGGARKDCLIGWMLTAAGIRRRQLTQKLVLVVVVIVNACFDRGLVYGYGLYIYIATRDVGA